MHDDELKVLLRKIYKELIELKREIIELKKERKTSIGNIVDSIMRDISDLVEREVSKAFKNVSSRLSKRVVFYPFKKGFSFFIEYPHRFIEREIIEQEVEDTLREIEEEIEGERVEEFKHEVFEDLITALNPSEVAETLSVLSNPDRLKILKLLYERDRYFGELEEILGIGPSSLRHHLSRLINAGLIKQERSRGKYTITKRGVAALILSSYMHKRILKFYEEE